MSFKEIEFIFNRALEFTFSRKKLCFTTAVLVFCGMLIVLCRTLAALTGKYLALSLAILPIFVSTAVFLFLGILLIRIYHHEVKKIPINYMRTLSSAKQLMSQVVFLSIPLVLAYLALWTMLGIFYLLKGIPVLGNVLGVVFSFGPFLLLFCFSILCILSVLMLFFLSPCIALQSQDELHAIQTVYKRVKYNAFSNIILLFLGMIPLLFSVGLMVFAATLTGKSYFAAQKAIEVGLQWFFIMLPFSLLLAPSIIFFFNFSAECHALMLKRMRKESNRPLA